MAARRVGAFADRQLAAFSPCWSSVPFPAAPRRARSARSWPPSLARRRPPCPARAGWTLRLAAVMRWSRVQPRLRGCEAAVDRNALTGWGRFPCVRGVQSSASLWVLRYRVALHALAERQLDDDLPQRRRQRQTGRRRALPGRLRWKRALADGTGVGLRRFGAGPSRAGHRAGGHRPDGGRAFLPAVQEWGVVAPTESDRWALDAGGCQRARRCGKLEIMKRTLLVVVYHFNI